MTRRVKRLTVVREPYKPAEMATVRAAIREATAAAVAEALYPVLHAALAGMRTAQRSRPQLTVIRGGNS
jgi:hypothetical protein